MAPSAAGTQIILGCLGARLIVCMCVRGGVMPFMEAGIALDTDRECP